MSAPRSNTFLRPDTLLGVCEAIGQDFGISPLLPRIGFALLLFWNLKAAVAIYLALGLAVLASRLLFPAKAERPADVALPAVPQGDNDADLPELARAA